jgi:hypothetical protein
MNYRERQRDRAAADLCSHAEHVVINAVRCVDDVDDLVAIDRAERLGRHRGNVLAETQRRAVALGKQLTGSHYVDRMVRPTTMQNR